MGSALQRAAGQALLPLLLFFFTSLPWRTHPETVRGRAGWVRGGVRDMDAAAKPPWTGSRRPPGIDPARPSAAFDVHSQPAATRGCAVRWKPLS
ncbi:hypothetical protein, partial [Bacillus velezensis]|uniref:hypothetical protein n=1 Tax=Bacillus velezensis TaxID=492670 RepID=UPI003D333E00